MSRMKNEMIQQDKWQAVAMQTAQQKLPGLLCRVTLKSGVTLIAGACCQTGLMSLLIEITTDAKTGLLICCPQRDCCLRLPFLSFFRNDVNKKKFFSIF